MSEHIDGGFETAINDVKLQVNYRWDCFGDEPTDYQVYVASDVRQETDICKLLSSTQLDEIMEEIAIDAREAARGR